MNKAPVYLVFGPQGSGKSTQAELLSEYLKLPFFDSGAELRKLVNADGSESRNVAKIMQSGELVPNNILRKIFDAFIDSHDCSNGIVTDGFPRNMTQVQLFEDLVKDYNWDIISFYVKITDKTAKTRLSKRYKIINRKKVFRNDDRPSIVARRLSLFKKETVPVIGWLRESHKVYDIDGEPSKDEVFAQIKNKLEK